MEGVLRATGVRLRAPLEGDETSFKALCSDAAAIGGLDHLGEYFKHYLHQQNRINIVTVDSNERLVRSALPLNTFFSFYFLAFSLYDVQFFDSITSIFM